MSPNDVRRAEDMDPLTQEGADEVVTVHEFSGSEPAAAPTDPAAPGAVAAAE